MALWVFMICVAISVFFWMTASSGFVCWNGYICNYKYWRGGNKKNKILLKKLGSHPVNWPRGKPKKRQKKPTKIIMEYVADLAHIEQIKTKHLNWVSSNWWFKYQCEFELLPANALTCSNNTAAPLASTVVTITPVFVLSKWLKTVYIQRDRYDHRSY